MRIAKTIVILFALVLVVMCFNAPILFSAEEHPWDGDGPGDGNDGAVVDPPSDTTIVDPGDGDEDRGSIYDPADFPLNDLFFNVQFLLRFYSIPGSPPENNGASSNTN